MNTQHSTADLAKHDEARAIAESTPCAIQECDGSAHEPYVAADKWMHSLPDVTFDSGAVKLGMWTEDSETFSVTSSSSPVGA